MKINIFEYNVMRKIIFSSEKPPNINKIKCVDHKIVVVSEALQRSSARQT